MTEPSDHTGRMARAAREMQHQVDPKATMQAAVDLAAQYVPGCDAAALTIIHRRGELRTDAYTDSLALSGDVLQYELGEGPCVDAVWSAELVHSPDLARDERWPRWAPRVAQDHGAGAMMCFRLFTTGDTLGALNLYSRTPGAFDTADRDEGLALAAHIALAIAAARATDNLTTALDTRTVIGQATGMLMERHRLTPDRAFAVLARISSARNLKISAVAQHLVATNELLDHG